MDPLIRRVDSRDALTVLLLLALVGFLVLVVHQQGQTTRLNAVEVAAIATPTVAPAVVALAPSATPADVPTETPVALLAVDDPTPVPTATAPATPTPRAPGTPTVVPATATAMPTATPTALPTETATVEPPGPQSIPTATAAAEPTVVPSSPVRAQATAVVSRPTATARPVVQATSTAAPTKAAGTVLAVELNSSSVARGSNQVVAVVATPGLPVTVTVHYPSGIVANYRGTADANGVYRVTFTVPAAAGTGAADVRVVGGTSSRETAFAVT